MHIAFPQQQGYRNTFQYYIIHTLPVLLCRDFVFVLGMVLKYFDNYMVLTKNVCYLVSVRMSEQLAQHCTGIGADRICQYSSTQFRYR